MTPEGNTAPYGRLALVSCDVNLVSWQNTTKIYTVSYACWSVLRSSSLSKISERDSNSKRSYDSDDSEYNFIPGYVNIGKNEFEDDGNLGNNNGVTGLHFSHPRVLAS